MMFTLQKNNHRYATITQQTSSKEVDPVREWADVVSRVLGYEDSTLDSPVDLFMDKKEKYCHVTAQDIADQLKLIVQVLGEDYLGFGPNRVGTHSI